MISRFETYEQYREIYSVIKNLCAIDSDLVDNFGDLPIKKLTDEALKAMEGCDFVRLHRLLACQWSSREILSIAEAEKQIDDFNSRVLCSLINSYMYENRLCQKEYKPLIDFHLDKFGCGKFYGFFKGLSCLISSIDCFILTKNELRSDIPKILTSYFARNKSQQSLSEIIDIKGVLSNNDDFNSLISGIVDYIDFGSSNYKDYNTFTNQINCNIIKKRILVSFITEKLKLCGNHSYLNKLMKTVSEEELNGIKVNVLSFFKEQLKKNSDDSYYIKIYSEEIAKYEKDLISKDIQINPAPKKTKKRI